MAIDETTANWVDDRQKIRYSNLEGPSLNWTIVNDRLAGPKS